MNILYALGYELYPQNSNFFDKEFSKKEKEYKKFLKREIEDKKFSQFMFYQLNRFNFKRFLIPYAVLMHMEKDKIVKLVERQSKYLPIFDDYLSESKDSRYFEKVDDNPYILSTAEENEALEMFYSITKLKWGKKSIQISIEKILSELFGDLRFRKGETTSYFRANYLAIYHLDASKSFGDLTKSEWFSIYSAVINNQEFIAEKVPLNFLLTYELINFCINKGSQEGIYQSELNTFLEFNEPSETKEDNSVELIAELNKKVRLLKNDLKICKKEIELLNHERKLVSKTTNEDNNTIANIEKTVTSPKNIEPKVTKEFPEKVVYFGGHPNLHNKLKQQYPNWVCFDPDNYYGDKKIINADLIIYDSKYNNHGQQERLKSLLPDSVPVIRVRAGTNEHLIIADALKKWNRL